MHEDPRVARSKAAILEATIDLLAERGVAETTISAIAERSGVAKTTIYRHWTSKPEVIVAALEAMTRKVEDPDSGDLRTDLQQLLRRLAAALEDTAWAAIVPSLIDTSERDPEFAAVHDDFTASRHQAVLGIIERGIERGDLPSETDPREVMALLAGPLFYRRLISRQPVTTDFADSIVARVMAAYGRGMTPEK